MKLLIVNPNTSRPMTEGIAAAARAVAAHGTRIEAVCPSFGPLSIEGHFDETVAAAGVAEQVKRHAGPGAVEGRAPLERLLARVARYPPARDWEDAAAAPEHDAAAAVTAGARAEREGGGGA